MTNHTTDAAAHALSLSEDDCNDPAQEHFDATMLACGEAVVHLINSSPRTPTAEQIRDLIHVTLGNGFETAPDEEAEEEEAEEAKTPIFDPISLPFDKDDIAYHLMIFQFGLAILGKDEAGLRKSIQGLLAEESGGNVEPNVIDRLLADMEDCEGKFGAMAHFSEIAKKRLALAALNLAGVGYVPRGKLTTTLLQAGEHRS